MPTTFSAWAFLRCFGLPTAHTAGKVEGFGEVFRMLSFEEIGTSTLQSRAIAGMANRTLIFAMPGSTKACRTAWENIIAPQLDARTRPCNFISHLKK